MSDSQYTPDTGQVRGHYAADERLGGEHNPDYAAEFDRWLEGVLNAARAEAWDEGELSGRHNYPVLDDENLMRNPYRQEAD